MRQIVRYTLYNLLTGHISDLSLVHKQSPKEPYQIVKVVTKNHYEMMDKSCSTDSGTYYVVLLQTKTPADETLLSVHNDLLQMGITILPKNDLTGKRSSFVKHQNSLID